MAGDMAATANGQVEPPPPHDGQNEQTALANEHPDHEAVLTGTIALANLFSTCVEAFNIIHPGHKWDKDEQLLLCRLGIQQARLLIWGDVVGITSPPASVTDRAVPKHPSAAYPDLKEPTFFGARDPRLDEPETRKTIENALSALFDRSPTASREEMMSKYGLKPPKRFAAEYQPALDTNRLEAFRERYELLKEVCETYAHLNTRRNNSVTHHSWMIADFAKFSSFITLTQEKIDFLIGMLDVKERVDRAMRMDIKALGWHLSADRARIAMDVSKLRLIAEASKDEYPEYLSATQTALDNIERERRENVGVYNPYAAATVVPVSTPQPSGRPSGRGSISTQGGAAGPNGAGAAAANGHHHGKRPSIFGGLFKSFGRKSHPSDIPKARSMSVAATANDQTDDPERALSDVGPLRPGSGGSMEPAEPVRSKSVGDILHAPINQDVFSGGPPAPEDEHAQNEREQMNAVHEQLARLNTNATVDDEVLPDSTPISSAISRHDQYHGLGRQGTHNQ